MLVVPDLNANLEAEFAKRKAASTPPAKADNGAPAPAAKIDKPDGAVAAPVPVKAVTEADKVNAPAPKYVAGLLDFLPEAVRSKVTVTDDEAAAVLKSGWMAHSSATQKFIEASNLRKEAEKLQRSASNYDALVADPDVALVIKAVEDKRNGKKPSAPVAVADDPALKDVDPAIVAALDKRAEAKVAPALQENAKLREEIQAMQRPQAARTAFNEVVGAFVAANGVEQDVIAEAIRLADADLEKDGQTLLTVDPKMLPILLRPQVEVARLKKRVPPVANANKNGAANGQAGTAEVASPTGRGGVHSDQSVPFPAHYVNGEPPRRPRTDAERSAEHDFHLKLAFGPNATAAELSGASR